MSVFFLLLFVFSCSTTQEKESKPNDIILFADDLCYGNLVAARRENHLSLKRGKWMYIPAQGSDGFTGYRPPKHVWGGLGAVPFVGGINSDIENNKRKCSPTQLYDMENDRNQSVNVYEKHPEVVREMESILDTYRPKINDQMIN